MRVAFAERIHFLLQLFRVFLQAKPGVPGIQHVAIGIFRFLPDGGIFGLDGDNEFLRFFRDFQFGMHGREQQQMKLDPAQFRSLPIHGPVCSEKNDDIEGNNSEGNHRPPAPLHVFMAKRDQHERVSIQGTGKD